MSISLKDVAERLERTNERMDKIVTRLEFLRTINLFLASAAFSNRSKEQRADLYRRMLQSDLTENLARETPDAAEVITDLQRWIQAFVDELEDHFEQVDPPMH